MPTALSSIRTQCDSLATWIQRYHYENLDLISIFLPYLTSLYTQLTGQADLLWAWHMSSLFLQYRYGLHRPSRTEPCSSRPSTKLDTNWRNSFSETTLERQVNETKEHLNSLQLDTKCILRLKDEIKRLFLTRGQKA